MQTPQTQSLSNPPQIFTAQIPPQPQYYYFRGYKKRLSQMNKTKMLKTKHLKQKQQKSLRYDNFELDDQQFLSIDMQNEQLQHQNKKIQDIKNQTHRRAKSQFQIMKISPAQKLQRIKRNLSSRDQGLMVKTSRMQMTGQSSNNHRRVQSTNNNLSDNNVLKNNKMEQLNNVPRFYSKNLHLRMNEYLNMVVAKSSYDHKQKLKKIRQEQELLTNEVKSHRQRDSKIFLKNKFLRQLKTRVSLNKKMLTNNYNQSTNKLNNNNNFQSNHYRSHNNQHSNNLLTDSNNIEQLKGNNNLYNGQKISSKQNSNFMSGRSNNIKSLTNDGQELINLASQMLSRSLKVYNNKKSNFKSNHIKNKSIQALSHSLQVDKKKL